MIKHAKPLLLGSSLAWVIVLPGCATNQHSGSGTPIGVEVTSGRSVNYSGMPPLASSLSPYGGVPDGARVIYPSSAYTGGGAYDRGASLFEWNGDGRTVSRIRIDRATQRATFYDGDQEIGSATVATGKSSTPTPGGTFTIMEMSANKRSNLYGTVYGPDGSILNHDARSGRDQVPDGARFEGALMPYWMRLTGDGVGLHAGYIPEPGSPASHGCVRLPLGLAPVLFKHARVGTTVEVL